MNNTSIYVEENIFTYKNKKYEALFNHPYRETFRVIFTDDDYDYIEDIELLKELKIRNNEEYNKKKSV